MLYQQRAKEIHVADMLRHNEKERAPEIGFKKKNRLKSQTGRRLGDWFREYQLDIVKTKWDLPCSKEL